MCFSNSEVQGRSRLQLQLVLAIVLHFNSPLSLLITGNFPPLLDALTLPSCHFLSSNSKASEIMSTAISLAVKSSLVHPSKNTQTPPPAGLLSSIQVDLSLSPWQSPEYISRGRRVGCEDISQSHQLWL